MLSSSYRFHGHKSLNFVYRHGKSLRPGSALSLKYAANPGRDQPRFAVIVSKKVFKAAVRRNRLRRRIYEIIRLRLPDFKAPYDIVITVFSAELLTSSPHDMQRHLDELLKPLLKPGDGKTQPDKV